MSRVVEAANVDVSYHIYGRYLSDERYRNSPFKVTYKIHNPSFYNVPFDLHFEGSDSFSLTYIKFGEKITETCPFAKAIKTQDFDLLVEKTSLLKSRDDSKYFFIIHSKNEQINILQNQLGVEPENFKAKTIKVSYKDHNPSKARYLVSLIDSLYLSYTREVKILAIEQKIQFLNDQIAMTEESLSRYESYFETFTIQNRTTDLNKDLSRTIEQLAKLDSQRYRLTTNIQELEIIQKKSAGKHCGHHKSPATRATSPPVVRKYFIVLKSTEANVS